MLMCYVYVPHSDICLCVSCQTEGVHLFLHRSFLVSLLQSKLHFSCQLLISREQLLHLVTVVLHCHLMEYMKCMSFDFRNRSRTSSACRPLVFGK